MSELKREIPFCDLKTQYSPILEEINSAIMQITKKANFILGEEVFELEEKIAEYIGVKYGVAVASGTDALVLALEACGIGQGDEVITTPLTFVATTEAIVRVGADPVFVDINESTYNIDADKIEDKLTDRTKAIIPVHLYGYPAEMTKINKIAKEYNLKVIEDCAQAMGAEYNGNKTGSLGNVGCFSFFPAKNLGCFGDGGMVLTDDKEIAESLRILRAHGCKEKYHQIMHGFNSRLDTLQAAILLVNLKYLPEWINKRISNAEYYTNLLESVKEIVTPKIQSGIKHSFNYYTIRIKNGLAKRDSLIEYLITRGISCGIYYPLLQHMQKISGIDMRKYTDLTVSEKLVDEILTLPMSPGLDKEGIDYIVKTIKEFI